MLLVAEFIFYYVAAFVFGLHFLFVCLSILHVVLIVVGVVLWYKCLMFCFSFLKVLICGTLPAVATLRFFFFCFSVFCFAYFVNVVIAVCFVLQCHRSRSIFSLFLLYLSLLWLLLTVVLSLCRSNLTILFNVLLILLMKVTYAALNDRFCISKADETRKKNPFGTRL